MFTQLFDRFVSGVGTMPGLMVYGIAGLWVGAESLGIPLPLELMLLFSGSLVALSQLNPIVVLGAMILTALAFAALSYMIGRRAGATGVLRMGRYIGMTQARIDHIEVWLRKRGALGVIMARIIPGIRLFSSYVMGIAGIPPATFAIGALIGTAVYFSIWLLIGMLLGPNYRVPLHYLDRLGLYGLALALVVVIAAFLLHQLWGRRNFGRLAAQHAHYMAALSAVGDVPQSGAMALSSTQANGRHMAALQSSSELSTVSNGPGTPTSARRRTRGLPSPYDHSPELRATRQAMRAAAGRLWPTWLARALVAGWLVVLALFLALAAAAHNSAVFPIDLSVSAWLRQLNATSIGRPITFLGDLQGPVGAAIAYVVVLSALIICRFFLEALCLAVAGLGAELTDVVVNGIVARPRPTGDISHTLANLGAHSFPSGHTANCVGLYGFILYLTALAVGTQPARSRWRPWLIAVQVICVVFILNVGVSRVVEEQHWPSDVVGAYMLGSLFLLLGIALYHVLAQREVGVASHGVLPIGLSISATTAHTLQSVGRLDHRIADDVGLRGPDLQAQVRKRWPSWAIALVSAIWIELATVVLILSVSAHRYATFPIDATLATTIQHLRGTVWASLIYPAGDLQWYLPTTIAYVVIFGTLLVLRLYLAAIFVALSSFGTDLINVTINAFVNRPRPHGVQIATLTGGNLGRASFPSGHVAHTIGLYGFVFFLCILAMRAQPRLKPWLIAIQVVCLYFIVFVGPSRVLEGQHWPSDVAGGYLVGVSVLALVIVLYHLVAMRQAAKQGARSSPETEGRAELSVTGT